MVEVGANGALAALDRGPTLARQVYDVLKDSIVAGRLQPGTDHTEAGLARELGTSRAPLREAVRQLQEEGFIDESSPRPGFAISVLTQDSIRDLYAVRYALERAAAEAAAARVIPAEEISTLAAELTAIDPKRDPDYVNAIRVTDFRFHDLWVRNSGNKMLERHIRRLRDHVVRVSYHVTAPAEHFEKAHAEHLEILDALRIDDRDGFVAAVSSHIGGVTGRILAAYGGSASPLD